MSMEDTMRIIDDETAERIAYLQEYVNYSTERLYASAHLANIDLEINSMRSELVYDPARKELTAEYNHIIKRAMAAQNKLRSIIAKEESK